MGDQFRFQRDVAVVVNGPATFGGGMPEPQPPVYIDEEQFYRATGMRASAPARVALIRLMQEDVTVKSLSCVWGDELVFRENCFVVRVDRWAPWFTTLLLVALGGSLLSMMVATRNHDAVWPALLSSLTVGAAFLVSLFLLYRPFLIAKRIAPMVEQVNRELPEILETWRRGR